MIAVIEQFFPDAEGAAARAAALRVQMDHGRDYYFHEGTQCEYLSVASLMRANAFSPPCQCLAARCTVVLLGTNQRMAAGSAV